jgi:hypothetical protein
VDIIHKWRDKFRLNTTIHFIRLRIFFHLVTKIFQILNMSMKFFSGMRFVVQNRNVNNALLFEPEEKRAVLFLHK